MAVEFVNPILRSVKGTPLTYAEMDNNWTLLSKQVPLGTVLMYAGVDLPGTFLECNGQSVTTAAYPDLFNVIGYTFGGAGANFNLPDTRGLFIRGSSTDAARDPDGPRAPGNTIQQDAYRSHNHAFHVESGQGPLDVSGGDAYGGTLTNVPPALAAGQTRNNGGDETRPKNIVMNFIIKAEKQ